MGRRGERRRGRDKRLRGTFDANPVHPLDEFPFSCFDRETLSNLPSRAAVKFACSYRVFSPPAILFGEKKLLYEKKTDNN